MMNDEQKKLFEERGRSVWKVGDLIDHMSEVREILGEGAMGTVYKVYYRFWNQEVAVKCPRPEIFARANGKERFIQEAETWTALGTYPHIVEGYFVRVVNGIPHVFAEYVPGGSLADWIEQRRLYAGGPEQALERILDLAIQFAWGLHFAHERGLVHQDVKPANVMMTADGTAKVTDFGLAKARLLAGEPTLAVGGVQQSMLVSSRGMTPVYCSPEQAAGHHLNRKTDIWSWGLSVLEMFLGEVHWSVGVVAREVLAHYRAEDLALPVMPAALIEVLKHCFQQEPAARPATMLEVAAELEKIYAHSVGHPYPQVMPQPSEIDAPFLVNQGLSLHELGQPVEALAAFEHALRLDPDYALAYAHRGVVLRKLGRPKEALTSLEHALRLDPNNALAYNNQGNVLRNLGRPKEALAAFEHALRLNPRDAAAYNNRGVVLCELRRPAEGLASFEEALRLSPNYTDACTNRGNALRELGLLEEALAAFEHALRLDPNYALAHAHRGHTLLDLGRLEEALAAFEHALRLNPNSAAVHYNRGLVLRKLGQPAEALAAFEQALCLNPNDVDAHHNRRIMLRELGR